MLRKKGVLVGKQLSERQLLATKLLELVRKTGYANPRKPGLNLVETNNRKHYTVPFFKQTTGRILEGEFRIYSSKFIQLYYLDNGVLFEPVYESIENATDFYKLFFVENNSLEAEKIPKKPEKTLDK